MLHSRYIYIRLWYSDVSRNGKIDLVDIMCPIEKEGSNSNAGFPVSSSFLSILVHASFSLLSLLSSSFSASLEKLWVRVTRLRRVTRRWPDTGKGIPGHWSRRRLSDVLSFRRYVSSVLYAPQRLNPLGDSCLSHPYSPPLSRSYLALSSAGGGGRVHAAHLFFFPTFPKSSRGSHPSSSLSSVPFPRLSGNFKATRQLQSYHSFRNKIVGLS